MSAYEILRKRLNGIPNHPPVSYENEPYTPQPGVLHLRESYLPAGSAPVGIEFGGSIDSSGIYQVSVFVGTGQGSHAARIWADIVAAHFARSCIDGVLIERVEIAPAIQDDGWYHIPVSVAWRVFA